MNIFHSIERSVPFEMVGITEIFQRDNTLESEHEYYEESFQQVSEIPFSLVHRGDSANV